MSAHDQDGFLPRPPHEMTFLTRGRRRTIACAPACATARSLQDQGHLVLLEPLPLANDQRAAAR